LKIAGAAQFPFEESNRFAHVFEWKQEFRIGTVSEATRSLAPAADNSPITLCKNGQGEGALGIHYQSEEHALYAGDKRVL
jgi:hypothetical protein